ncbi:MAG: ArnT family glycosyltransferase, partial [Anaerolineales bacterium]
MSLGRSTLTDTPGPPAVRRRDGYSLALGVVLAAAAAFRFIGLNWDENQHLHPDERFLTMVETSLRLPANLADYFDTNSSPLNPHNTGYPFFVYGTFPIFLVRFLGEYLGRTGYDEIHLVGRAAAATFDLASIVLLFLIGARLYDRRVALASAVLAACTPLLIQHAHFFVVDSFTLTFVLGAFYFAVRAGDESRWANEAFFGLAVGLALASKVSAFPVAGLLPLASAARIARAKTGSREAEVYRLLLGWLVAGAAAFVTFRIFQPYAFAWPGLLGLTPNPKWVANLVELRNQSSGNVDFPPALQ